MKQQRVNAFTLMEVTITMLLAGLLIGITYTIYSIVIKSYLSFKAKNEKIVVVVSLDHVIKRDFDLADSIVRDSDGIDIIKSSQTIKYLFYPNFVLRKTNKIDTFKVANQGLITRFESTSISNIAAIGGQNKIDDLYFILVVENETIPYHYHKLYSSENLIQQNSNAIN